MKRRDFIKVSGAATGAMILVPGALAGRPETGAAIACSTETDPFLELRGSPFRKSCDGLADYNDASFEDMCEDMAHHRMPEDWQCRYLLRIE